MNSMKVVIWLLVLALASAAYGGFLLLRKQQQRSHQVESEESAGHNLSPRNPRFQAGDPVTYRFTLTDQLDKPFDSKSLEGKVWIGAFFFTNCPGPCWRLNQALAGIDSEFGKQGVEIISVTCDPKNDMPATLAKYADRLQANAKSWKFLTGDMTTIMLIGEQVFKLSVAENIHSEKCVVFDRQMRMRGVFNCLNEDDVSRLRELLAKLLDEKAPAPATATAAEATSAPATPAPATPAPATPAPATPAPATPAPATPAATTPAPAAATK